MRSTLVDLGFDLGTTVTKLTVLDEHGSRRAQLSLPTQWRDLGRGMAEVDPGTIVDAVEGLIARAALETGPGTVIRSIGFTSMAEAGVLVDARDREQSPVIAWHDPRGAEQAARLPDDFAHDFPAMTGLPVSHVASVFKLAWLRDQGLDLRGLQWLSVPEFVILRLGGRRVAELSLLARTGLLNVHRNRPWTPSFDYLGVDEDLVPEIVAAGAPAGTVRGDHPVEVARGAVLTVAGHDHAVAAAAAGCGIAGSTLDSFGTAEAFIAAGDRVPDPDSVRDLSIHGVCVYPHVVKGATGFIVGTRTGLVLKRILRVLGAEEDPCRSTLDAAASALPQWSAKDVVVSGYAMSDQGVEIHLRSDNTTPALVWRAAIDAGTAHAAGLLDRLRSAGIAVDRLVVAGGWARMSSVLDARQGLAPVVDVSNVEQPGTFGAACFGRWAAGGSGGTDDDHRPPAEWFTQVARDHTTDSERPLTG